MIGNALPCLTRRNGFEECIDLQMNLYLQARCKLSSILLRCMDMLLRWDSTYSRAMFSTGQSSIGRGGFTRQLTTLR